MPAWMHVIVWLIVGYVLGYYFAGFGDMTIGKLVAK